jgi:ethanolamine utilization protein EutA
MTSIGLDVGTSTTKFVVSRIRVSAKGNAFAWSDYEITERQVVYESPVYFTPLVNPDVIDHAAVSELLMEELRKAGVDRQMVKSGAVIVTGETAAKANAEMLLHRLSVQAGDFVAAAAGPDLEGILAGKGAGAERRSLASGKTVANIDVGGGTANVALFRQGSVLATVTFHIGGRLIRLEPDGTVKAVSPSIRHWLERRGWDLRTGALVAFSTLQEIAEAMTHAMIRYLAGYESREAEWLCVSQLPSRLPPIDEVMISGGVAELMRQPAPRTIAETAVYHDIGPLLAHALAAACRRYPWTVVEAEQTVRATVIGAGKMSMELSGSTIHADDGALPLRNVPVVKVESRPAEPEPNWQAVLTAAFDKGFRLYGNEGRVPFAIALLTETLLSYSELGRLADALAGLFRSRFTPGQIAVIVMEKDMAKALGQLLRLRCNGDPQIVCIDNVKLQSGDFIDIGERIAGCPVPVTVKTLLFPNKRTEVIPFP